MVPLFYSKNQTAKSNAVMSDLVSNSKGSQVNCFNKQRYNYLFLGYRGIWGQKGEGVQRMKNTQYLEDLLSGRKVFVSYKIMECCYEHHSEIQMPYCSDLTLSGFNLFGPL